MKNRLSAAVVCLGASLLATPARAQEAPTQQPPAPAEQAPAPVPAPAAPAAGDSPVRPTDSSTSAAPSSGPSTPPPTPAPLSRDARIRELESKVERLSRAMADLKAPAAPPSPPPPPVPTVPAPAPEAHVDDPLHGIVITGYLQSQLENHDDSEDQLRPGGTPLNQNRFLIRRGRIRVEREWQYSALMMEIDGNTTKGPAIQLFKAEASLLYRAPGEAPSPPMVKLTMGLFDAPFGYEVLESPRNRFFMERSLQSRAFFPTEPDLGVRLSGELGWFRYSLAVQNGEPLGTVNFPGQDPNNHKDFIARIGAIAKPDPSKSPAAFRCSTAKAS